MQSEASLIGKTGVEMEALTAVSVAALTIYDMCKSLDKTISISSIKLIHKSGGKSGFLMQNNELISVEQAIKKIVAQFDILEDEDVELTNSIGRISAEPLFLKLLILLQMFLQWMVMRLALIIMIAILKLLESLSAGNPFTGEVKKKKR